MSWQFWFLSNCLGHAARHKGTEPSPEGNFDMPVRSGRLEKRVPLAVPVEISTSQDSRAVERTSTENFCPHGVRVLTRSPKELNERVVIRSLIEGIKAVARVVYCQRLSDGRYGVGMQFLGSGPKWQGDSKRAVAD